MPTDDLAHASTAALSPDTAFAQTVLQALDGAAPATSAPATLPAGAERYVLAQLVGEGGMGTVFEARDLQFSRTVAVKQLLHHRAGAAARERFSLEALVTGNLEHPGVPTVYERGVLPDGSPYYAMRLVRGRTLTQAIADAPHLAGRLKLVPVVIKIAQTLGFAHERGIVHRDVKPDNVIVGRYGEAVMLDWGIAKVRGITKSGEPSVSRDAAADGRASDSSAATRHGAIIGTPAYMAPEQATGDVDKIDERTDVFALGALLYHLLTGQAPYGGATLESVVARAAKAEVEPLARAAPEAPVGIRTICERAMARAPDDRFQSAADLADALESFTAEAVAGRESGAVGIFATALSVAAIVGLFFGIVLVAMISSSFRDQGWVAYFSLAFALGGATLSTVDWITRGRHRLGPLAFAFALTTFFLGGGAVSRGLAHVLADESRLVFYVELTERVPPDRRAEVAELVTRANYGIIIGNFELDFGEGRLRYKTSVDYEGVELLPRVVRNLTLDAVDGVKPYAKAMGDVATGVKSAVEAIAEAEGEMDTA